MYSDKRKQEERYPYFLAIQITVVELPCEFSYLFGGLALTVLNILLGNTCTHFFIFCFTVIIFFFQSGPYFYSERFRKRNLEIKYVSIQSTWGRLGSLINVALASWQKYKQACMKSRPCRVIQWIVTSSNQRWSQLCEMVWNDCKCSKIRDIEAV